MKKLFVKLLPVVMLFLALGNGATAQNSNPDIPDFARFKINKEDFMLQRSEALGRLRGIDNTKVFDPTLRMKAVRQMLDQQSFIMERSANSPSTTAAPPTWTPIGPAPIPNGQTELVTKPVSGRTTAIAVHPTNPNIVYVGVAQGGVYRTTDGGLNWMPIFDAAASLAIGSIAISPSQPETIYVGTGEQNFSADSYFGVGVYRIDNASTTATLSGPFNKDAGAADVFTGRGIGKIIVHPSDPNTIFVSSTSGVGGIIATSNNILPSRGIYRCTNATAANPVFAKLTGLITNFNVSVRDMAIDPLNPNILICMPVISGSVQGGIYRSTNALNAIPGNVTFTQTLSITASSTSSANGEFAGIHPNGDANATFYAALGFSSGQVYRSTDGGATWTLRVDNNFCGGQCFYDIAIAVDPTNVNTVYLGGDPSLVSAKSTDGGATFTDHKSGVHVDTHAFAVSPSNPSQVWLGTDGGIYKSTDAGLTWVHKNTSQFNATQFMSIAVHPTDPNFTIGGTQDNGTNFFQPAGTWTRSDYGDGGYAQIDQNAANVTNVRMYHTYFNATGLQGYATTNTSTAFENWTFRGCQVNGATTNGITCNGVVNFYAPLERGPGTPNTIYYGSDRLYRSANEGLNHTVVSQNPIESGVPISAIGISPQDDGVRVVGLNSGGLYGTSSGSATLLNLDAANTVPNVAIARVVIDPNTKTTAYVTLSAFGQNSVWKTTFLDALNPTWTSASSGLPQVPVSSFVVDSSNSQNLFAGTDIGVYASTNGGATWSPYGTGLPVVAVFGMAITPGNKLRIATHGRGMWETGLSACETPQQAPAEVTIANSTCNTVCTVSGGSISAPAGTPCPTGFSIQYQVNGGSWTSTLPTYAQAGPAQTIKTKCTCTEDENISSPASAGVTTAPASCATPVVNNPQVTQPTCLLPTGRIIVRVTGTEAMQYSIDNGTTYKNTASFANLAPGNNYRIKVRFAATPNCVTTYINNPITINPPPPTPAWYLDADGDGYYGSSQSACSSPGTGWTSTPPSGGGGDCNDDPLNGGASINPGVTEVCNGKDDNCNGLTDDGILCNAPTVTSPQVTQPTCLVPTGRIIVRATGTEAMQYSVNNGGTFKNTASFTGLAPGNYYVVVRYASTPANQVPWAGNPVVINPGPPPITWYWDLDNDGYYGATQAACSSPGTGWTSTPPPGGGGDCNDDPLNGGANINPGAIELCNGIDDNCNGWVDDGTIVLVAPTSISGPAGVCRNATNQVFSVTPVADATSYQWTLPTGATGSSTTSSISVSFNSTYVSGNICVRAVNACGQSAQFCRQIKYYDTKPATPGTITGKAIGLCNNENYSVVPLANTTNYNWVAPSNTSIVSGQGTPQIVLSFGVGFVSGTLSVSASNCKGTSALRTKALSRDPATPGSIIGPVTEVCAGSTKNYSCPLVTGATNYIWTVPADAVINSGQGTNAISVTFPASFVSGYIRVASGTSCGSGAQRSVSLSSKPTFPAAITGPVSVCPSATGLPYSTAAVAGVTNYNWIVPAGATITSGQGTASILVNWGTAAGMVKVQGRNACGTSAYRSLSVSLLSCTTATITMAKAKAEEAAADKTLRFQLSPNPADKVLLVRLEEFVPNRKMELTLIQADGKVLQSQSLIPTLKGQQVSMDVSRAAVGYYILSVKQQDLKLSKQVIIIR